MKQFRVIERQSVLVEYLIEAESEEAYLKLNGQHNVLSKEEIDILDAELVSIEEE